MAFDYGAPAELFMAKRRGGARQPLGYRRFATAAEAIRFAVEDFPAVRTLGAWMQVGDERSTATPSSGSTTATSIRSSELPRADIDGGRERLCSALILKERAAQTLRKIGLACARLEGWAARPPDLGLARDREY